ncbi:glycosyltransferase [Candidatus Saccharibacteria bacterium]|nr:glycosyltransferase [Candidatus Saccharibacteria bacterium]MBR2710724.1 glycosyltransferase [Candidatus Saccharibacteria bacterium]
MNTVSAVLPNYNYGKYLSSRIDEILSQTYPISELIILDDASTDNSVEIIRQKIAEVKKLHPNLVIKTIFNKSNSNNVFSQWQKGIALATSDYIWIAEADDVASKHFLEFVMRPASSHKDLVLSYSNSKYITEHNKLSKKDSLRKMKDFFRKRHISRNYIIDGKDELNKNLAIYNTIPNVSATVFKNQPSLAKFLDEAKVYKLSGDWFFYIKVAETGKIAYCSKTLNSHRLHSTSVTTSTSLKQRYREMEHIHNFVKNQSFITTSTKSRMAKLEASLKKHWEC